MMSYVLFTLISIVWGASFILMKRAALSFGPVGVGAWRSLSGAAVLGAIWALHRSGWPFGRRHLVPLAFLVLVGFALPYCLQPYLISRCGSGFIGMMVSLVPLLTILVSIPLLRAYPTPRQVLGVLGGLGCMAVIFADGLTREVRPAYLCLAFLVPLAHATCNTYVKRAFAGIPPLALSCCAMAFSGAILLPTSLSVEQMEFNEHLPMAVGAMAVLGVLGTGIAMFIFYKLIQEQGPLFAGMVTYLVPMGAVVWGWLDGEQVTVLQLTALAGVLAMVLLVQYGAARRPIPESSDGS